MEKRKGSEYFLNALCITVHYCALLCITAHYCALLCITVQEDDNGCECHLRYVCSGLIQLCILFVSQMEGDDMHCYQLNTFHCLVSTEISLKYIPTVSDQIRRLHWRGCYSACACFCGSVMDWSCLSWFFVWLFWPVSLLHSLRLIDPVVLALIGHWCVRSVQ